MTARLASSEAVSIWFRSSLKASRSAERIASSLAVWASVASVGAGAVGGDFAGAVDGGRGVADGWAGALLALGPAEAGPPPNDRNTITPTRANTSGERSGSRDL